jgi:murein DD-endopeptidase MepM/ murein hydrolase activator NlpD
LVRLRKQFFVILLFTLGLALGLTRANAQQQIVVKIEFDYLKQGTAGIISLTGPEIVSATAQAMDHNFPFYPTSQGLGCIIAAPMDQKIRNYPLLITITRKDGSRVSWQGSLKVSSGGFIEETPYVLPSDKVYLLRDDIQQSEDYRLTTTYDMITPQKFWEGAFTPPVNGALSSPFGSFRSFNGIARKRHTGYDFTAATGTPVLASASGRVVLSIQLPIHGNNIVIDHGWGVFTEYAHLSERYVVPGQFVLQGDVIGLSGSTGRSTGPHVHWEIAVNGIWVNPILFMQTRLPS